MDTTRGFRKTASSEPLDAAAMDGTAAVSNDRGGGMSDPSEMEVAPAAEEVQKRDVDLAAEKALRIYHDAMSKIPACRQVRIVLHEQTVVPLAGETTTHFAPPAYPHPPTTLTHTPSTYPHTPHTAPHPTPT